MQEADVCLSFICFRIYSKNIYSCEEDIKP